jgi:hypothetical protein
MSLNIVLHKYFPKFEIYFSRFFFLHTQIKMQSIFDITKKEEDLYSILNCVDTSSVRKIFLLE